MNRHKRIESPIGTLTLVVNAAGILSEIRFAGDKRELASTDDPSCACEAADQLAEYFEGLRQQFNIPLAPRGTEFQKAVWKSLLDLPFGSTSSYADIAARIGRPNAVRAVGAANGANPIPIIIPCHRVIGADGSLTGYGGGLHIKRRLLEHEGSLQPALI